MVCTKFDSRSEPQGGNRQVGAARKARSDRTLEPIRAELRMLARPPAVGSAVLSRSLRKAADLKRRKYALPSRGPWPNGIGGAPSGCQPV